MVVKPRSTTCGADLKVRRKAHKMIRFGNKYFKIESVTELVADNGEFGFEFRRLCKMKFQEDNFLFLHDVVRRRPPQRIYLEYIIPTLGSGPRPGNLQAYDATPQFPFGHRPKTHIVATPRRVRVNLGRGLNISDAVRAPMIALANANRWSEGLWRPALETAVADIKRLLDMNGTTGEYYASDAFLQLFERLVMPCVQQQHVDTLALTNGLSSAVKKDLRLREFLRYAKASVFFGLPDIECTRREQMFRRAAEEMLQKLKADHELPGTFDSLKVGAWRA
ncbi:hypothetical protein Fuma_06263 [Fuerstiella marisgermanici]|uniref:Uncharacterized protein n=2 Tax=Fuerstiella marisgermanici TaxID=1891926 RepID=A0A1P8WRA8_9PLAN|nr:hypothetical protein Fuma_06263 [Fuerstiella marisgermanici]